MARKKGNSQMLGVVVIFVMLIIGVLWYTGNLQPMNQQQSVVANERLVYLQIAVQDRLSDAYISGAQVYIWKNTEPVGDYFESITTDTTGLATTVHQEYLTGSTIFVFVKAAGYYPAALQLTVPSADKLASEQTTVGIGTVKLYKISATVSMDGSTIGSTVLSNSGTGSVSTSTFLMSIKIGGLQDDTVFGSGPYVDYSTVDRKQYDGPYVVIEADSTAIAPETTPVTTVTFGTKVYYVFKYNDIVVNDADDPTDGTATLDITFNNQATSAVNVTLNIYLFDSVDTSLLSFPQNLIGSQDAAITGFVLTVNPPVVFQKN